MSRPICSFYYQNLPQSSHELDEVRSTGTQFSKRSSSTKVTVQRSNEIKPSKVVIPKISKPPKQTLQAPSQRPVLDLQEDQAREISESKEEKYKLFSWKSLGTFCGVSAPKESINGCLCKSACKYKEQWSHPCSISDLTAFRGLKTIRTKEEFQVQIDKDIHRTYSNSATFGNNARYRDMLRQVLIAYSVYDGEVGYVQGMNLITANLLYHIKTAPETFWALVELMEYQQLRLIYTGKLEHLGVHTHMIENIIKTDLREIHKQIVTLGISTRCFLDGWLLSLMSKVVPLEQMPPILTNFREKGWPFLYRLVIELLRTLTNCLLLAEDEPEFLMCLDEQSCREVGVEWASVTKKAEESLK